MQRCIIALVAALGMTAPLRVQAAEIYAGMLDALRAEITAKLPTLDEATRNSIVEAKDAKARVAAVRKLTTLDPLLASDALDAKLAKVFVIHEATPAGLETFAAQGAARGGTRLHSANPRPATGAAGDQKTLRTCGDYVSPSRRTATITKRS